MEDRDVEWVRTDEDAVTSTTEVGRRGIGRRMLLAAAITALVLLGVSTTLARGDQADTGDDVADAPTTTSAASPGPGPEPTPAVEIAADGVQVPARAREQLTELAALGVPLRLVITSPTSARARLVSVADDRVEVSALPRLSDLAFDPTGGWIAGVGFTELGEQRRILWAGRVGATLEPVAVGIRSFAWHGQAPGRLAWTEPGSTTVTSLDLAGAELPARTELPASGILQGWGDWGYALQASGRAFTTTIVSPDGRQVLVDHPGRFAAHLPGLGVLVSGGLRPPTLLDPTTGAASAIEELTADDFVWAAAPLDRDHRLLVVPGVRGTPGPGTLVAFDGEAVTTLAATPTVTRLAAADEDTVVLVDQAGADGADGRIAVLSSAGRTDAPVPDLFSGREWVLTLTSRRLPSGQA